MANEGNDLLKFIGYIEEHQDVLTKSQTKEQKQRKAEAAEQIIKKWTAHSGKTLSEASLLKKINNTKSRAKSALSAGKPLNEWQSKILQIAGADNDNEGKPDQGSVPESNTVPAHANKNDDSGARPMRSNAEKILDKYETDETKVLTDKQLQRLVLLKQVKVLSMQQQHLESQANEQVTAEQNVVFDFVDWSKESQCQDQ